MPTRENQVLEAHRHLAWPSDPLDGEQSGVSSRVLGHLLTRKVQRTLTTHQGSVVKVFPLVRRDDRPGEPMLALVCSFREPATSEALGEAHRLAWNFGHTPLLIVIEPGRIRAWSCYETPQSWDADDPLIFATSFEDHAAELLHWVYLTENALQAKYPDRFLRQERVDQTLLSNLKTMRRELMAEHPDLPRISRPLAHDLLARLVFIQFLRDRTDSEGRRALSDERLASLAEDGILSKPYSAIADILQSKGDTYALFRWLDNVFNGDLFPGKEGDAAQREDAWQSEMLMVSEFHFHRLADFIRGTVVLDSGQMSFWPHYSFDAIPLEFISSIYEEFVSPDEDAKGAHYTPPVLVDFLLDRVLPWEGERFDLRLLDPACGSGVFLVKSFHRLVWRWRQAHPGQDPPIGWLKSVLTDQLHGVDRDINALRTASLSLYLALCDEIDPKDYWAKVEFPKLRGLSLVASDFFDVCEGPQYDLIVGNAPWGQDSMTESVEAWASKQSPPWSMPSKQSGPLFMPKAMMLLEDGGRLSIIQPATLLHNHTAVLESFRSRLFSDFRVEEVVNLLAIRYQLYSEAKSASCIMTLAHRYDGQDCDFVDYVVPKTVLNKNARDEGIRLSPYDFAEVPLHEASSGDAWSILAWGGQRDFELVRRLQTQFDNLSQLGEEWVIFKSGFKRGTTYAEPHPETLGLRILEEHERFKHASFLEDVSSFPRNENPNFEATRNDRIFHLPALVLKQSWSAGDGRFKAVLVQGGERLLYSQSFATLSPPPDVGLERMVPYALLLNSQLAVYWALMRGRIGHDRPTVRWSSEARTLPSPPKETVPGGLQLLEEGSPDDIDSAVRAMYELSESDWMLIEDAVQGTMRETLAAKSEAYRPTRRGPGGCLEDYVEWLLRSLRYGIGRRGALSATIFEEDGPPLPVRLVAVTLRDGVTGVGRVSLRREALLGQVVKLNREHESFSNIVYAYRMVDHPATPEQPAVRVPTIFVVKPDLQSLWKRSYALRDGDEIIADMISWVGFQ